MACVTGGKLLASFLFAGMRWSAKEDENWISSVAFQRITILCMHAVFFLKCHNFRLNGFCCTCTTSMLFVYLSGIFRTGDS